MNEAAHNLAPLEAGTRALVLGLGRTGLSAARYLRRKGRMREALDVLKQIQRLASEQIADYPGIDSVQKRFRSVQEEMSSLIEAVARGAN